MEHYKRGEIKEIEINRIPFSDELIGKNICEMKIRSGTKSRNIINFVKNLFEDDQIRMVVFSGYGNACTKAISCCEMFKRQYQTELFQWTKLVYRRIEEYWEPDDANMDRLKVNRDIPAIYMLISKDTLPELLTNHQQRSTETMPPFVGVEKSETMRTKRKPPKNRSSNSNIWNRKAKKSTPTNK